MNKVFDDFTIHIIDGHISSIFLAVYPDKILVLDGGCRCDVGKIETYITRKLKRDISNVKLVVASHAHPDHAGGSPLFSEKYGLPLAAPRNINTWYRGPMGFIQHKVDTFLGYYVARTFQRPFENMFYTRNVKIDHILDDGSSLPGFEDWIAYDALGHTNHDMVFYNQRQKALYAADVILCVNGKYLVPFPVPLREHMRDTLDRLSTLKVRTLILAHGGIKVVSSIKGIVADLKAQLSNDLPPLLQKLMSVSRFSPEIRKAKNERRLEN
jgi:glyoxylase-like metal-dependent hydrolase (beta-lactamase superfamily II)